MRGHRNPFWIPTKTVSLKRGYWFLLNLWLAFKQKQVPGLETGSWSRDSAIHKTCGLGFETEGSQSLETSWGDWKLKRIQGDCYWKLEGKEEIVIESWKKSDTCNKWMKYFGKMSLKWHRQSKCHQTPNLANLAKEISNRMLKYLFASFSCIW